MEEKKMRKEMNWNHSDGVSEKQCDIPSVPRSWEILLPTLTLGTHLSLSSQVLSSLDQLMIKGYITLTIMGKKEGRCGHEKK